MRLRRIQDYARVLVMSFLADSRELKNTSAAANRLLTRTVDEVETTLQSISTRQAEEKDRMKGNIARSKTPRLR
jgi:hypothetical protein